MLGKVIIINYKFIYSKMQKRCSIMQNRYLELILSLARLVSFYVE